MASPLEECFAEPLYDLASDDARLRGIFAPESERGAAGTGATAQFLANAREYHERYANVEGFRTLLSRYLAGEASHASTRFILDNGKRRIYRRLGKDEAAPQNLRSTEKCAS